MTTAPTVIDAAPDTPASRPFRVVTHKPAVAAVLAGFGGTQDIGISVDSETADATLWWMPLDWAVQVRQAEIGLPQLTAPGRGWVAGLPERFRHRRVGTLRKTDIPRFYAKHPQAAQDCPQVVLSPPGEVTDLLVPTVVEATDLAEGRFPPGYDRLPETTLLQIDQMLACVVEVRCWIAHGEVTAHAPYRLGLVGWESALFLEMLFNADGQALTETALEVAKTLAADVDGPPGYAVDLGVTADGTVTVLRAWPAWAVEPLHADPTGVFAALAAAHDFDYTNATWRWNPDLAVYTRPHAAPTEEEIHEFFTDPPADGGTDDDE